MTTSAIAQRYASALVDVVMADRDGNPDQALDALRSFRDLVASSVNLRHALESPAVSPTRKRAILDRLAEKLAPPRIVRNFLLVLSDKRRLPLLNEVTEHFDILLDERRGFVRAYVHSATELDDAERDQIARQLSHITQKQVRTQFTVDTTMIGGVVARVGSTVYDGSVRGQLARMRRHLA